MVDEKGHILYVDSSYGDFNIMVASRLGMPDYAEISLTRRAKERMEYFCPLPDKFRINLSDKKILTDEDRGNKKRGWVSLIKLQRKFLYNHQEIDTKGLVNAVNYSLSIMRKSPLYHRKYTSK